MTLPTTTQPKALPPSSPVVAVPAVAYPDPASNIPPSPNFLGICGSIAYNDSPDCVLQVIAAIDNARAIETLPPIALPMNWTSLTQAEQLFVVTNLERTARGLAPLSAMASPLDAAAAQAAVANVDPEVPSGFPWTRFGGNWAGGLLRTPLEAMYYWMYDDGLGSSNVECSSSNQRACWGHRRNVLLPLSCTPCVMGAASVTTSQGTTSTTELIVNTEVFPVVDFTWAQEERYFP